MHNEPVENSEPRWAELTTELRGRQAGLVDKFMHRLEGIADYTSGLVDLEEVRITAEVTMRLLTESLTRGRAAGELLELAAGLGGKRARQGIPLESLIGAVRLDFSVLWSELLAISRPEDAALLASRVEPMWQVVDEFAAQTHAAYLAERVRMAQDESDYRKEFIARLFGPAGQTPDVAAKAAAALGLPVEGALGVAAAAGADGEALRQWAATGPRRRRCFIHQADRMAMVFWPRSPLADGWGAHPVGLPELRCGLDDDVEGLRAVWSAAATTTRLAQLLTDDDAGPITLESGWARLARQTVREAGLDLRAVIEQRLAECKESERERLEETVRAFLASGNVAATAAAEYRHRNTILNRLRRFEELTGLDLMVPAQAARVVVAWS